jgi:hypothetical protein
MDKRQLLWSGGNSLFHTYQTRTPKQLIPKALLTQIDNDLFYNSTDSSTVAVSERTKYCHEGLGNMIFWPGYPFSSFPLVVTTHYKS